MHAGAKPEVFRFAEALREKMTAPEKKLWIFLSTKPNGFKFRRQHPFNKYVLDFYCHHARLAIEIDGGYHYHEEQKKLDQERTKAINEFGVEELRFPNEAVMDDFEDVKDEISAYLHGL